jgi:hypothetical protein
MASPACPAPMTTVDILRTALLPGFGGVGLKPYFTSTMTFVGLVMKS